MTSAPQEFTERTGIPAYKWDVADYDACQEGVSKVEAELGPVDVLVNNAGITRDTTMKRMDHDKWQEVIDTNLGGCFNMAKAVFEGMLERGYGRIVNIGSINGQAGQYGQVNYAAAKSGIHGFTKALAQEGARAGVTVNAIAPGYIDTDMVAAVPEDVLGKIVAKIPGQPARQGRGDRPRRRLPGRRECRLHHRLDAVDQRRPAHVLMDGVGYAPPVKRSVLIAGHQTSISLEPMFWRALEARRASAAGRSMPWSRRSTPRGSRSELAAEPDLGDPPVAVRAARLQNRLAEGRAAVGRMLEEQRRLDQLELHDPQLARRRRRRCRPAHRSPAPGAAASACRASSIAPGGGSQRLGHSAEMRLDPEVARLRPLDDRVAVARRRTGSANIRLGRDRSTNGWIIIAPAALCRGKRVAEADPVRAAAPTPRPAA